MKRYFLNSNVLYLGYVFVVLACLMSRDDGGGGRMGMVMGSEDEEDESGSGDYEDDDGFFEFNDEYEGGSWEEHSMVVDRCMEYQNEDVVAFTVYGQNNKDCSKNKIGTYQASLPNFIKAYSRQSQINAQVNGYGYDLDEDLMTYLQCTYYQNNNGFEGYIKLSCNPNTGHSLTVKVYNDDTCSQKANQQTNLNFDLSALKVRFESCKSCDLDNAYYNNDDGNNNNNNRKLEDEEAEDDGEDYYYWNSHKDQTPLCSAAWNYKSTCNRKCVKMATQSSRQKQRGFSGPQRFFLFCLMLSAAVLSVAVYGLRRRMDTQDTVLENTVIKRSGLKKEWIPKIFLGIIVVILFFMALKVVSMTFFLLLMFNLGLFCYWAFLKHRKDGQVDVAGVVLYGGNNNTDDLDEPSTDYRKG
mmetsp:Transcript_24720/g.23745  ORF Transcript_24720/g.23745 Transcript_24720/m.23745 type:complete len:412 (-) Transcript_24720:117-1352(-)